MSTRHDGSGSQTRTARPEDAAPRTPYHAKGKCTREATTPDGSPGQTWMACAPATPASAPSSTIARPPAPPSSAGWNSRRTLPGSAPRASRTFSKRAAAACWGISHMRPGDSAPKIPENPKPNLYMVLGFLCRLGQQAHAAAQRAARLPCLQLARSCGMLSISHVKPGDSARPCPALMAESTLPLSALPTSSIFNKRAVPCLGS